MRVAWLPMRPETLKGHLDGMLLAALEPGPRHGYAIMEVLRAGSGGQFDLPTGTIYPALRRLERGGRTPAPRLRADPGGPPHAGRRARHLAAVLRRRHRLARTRAPAGDLMTRPSGAPPGCGRPLPPGHQLVEDYLAEVGARLPGPGRERAGIIAELRGGLLDAVDAYRDGGLSRPGAGAGGDGGFGDPGGGA